MGTELEELKLRQNSKHLWKPHADALAALIEFARKATQEFSEIAVHAANNGLAEEARALSDSLQRLRERAALAVRTLPPIAPQTRAN